MERPTKVRNRDTHCFYRRWSSTLIPADDLCIRLEMVNFELKTRDMIYNAYQIAFRKKISRITVHIEKNLCSHSNGQLYTNRNHIILI